MARFLVLLLACLVITITSLAHQSAAPGKELTIPESMSYNPPPIELREWPEACVESRASDDCFRALDDCPECHLWLDRDHRCTPEQIQKLIHGTGTAQTLLTHAARFPTDYHKDPITAEYWMGPDWLDYQDVLKRNIVGAFSYINLPRPYGGRIIMSCGDPHRLCRDAKWSPLQRIGGYAWSEWNLAKDEYDRHINMCPQYYGQLDIPGRMQELNRYLREGYGERLRDMRYYETDGQYLIHEMMHLDSTWFPGRNITGQPLYGRGGLRAAYKPRLVYLLAHGDADGDTVNYGAKFATINADSYAMLINCMYWWDIVEEFPGVPGKPHSSSARVIDSPPSLAPFISSDSSVSIDDAAQVEQFIRSYLAVDDEDARPPALPELDNNNCHGVSGDYWVRSRDTAVDNANDFCHQDDRSKRYNIGSANELEFSATNLVDESKRPKDDPDCLARLRDGVIDGCDNDDRINNPHNYKFGSTLTTTDGWSYRMTPLAKQVVGVTCDVSYRFFFDSFEIRGKNLPDAYLGPNGERLQDHLAECGVLTEWRFEFTPDDCCFQWYASGQLPIGNKDCIGDALLAAGGNSRGNCHGPG